MMNVKAYLLISLLVVIIGGLVILSEDAPTTPTATESRSPHTNQAVFGQASTDTAPTSADSLDALQNVSENDERRYNEALRRGQESFCDEINDRDLRSYCYDRVRTPE